MNKKKNLKNIITKYTKFLAKIGKKSKKRDMNAFESSIVDLREIRLVITPNFRQ